MAEEEKPNQNQDAEILGDSQDSEKGHEVQHNDEQNNLDDPKKVAFTHWLLVGLSFFGMIAIILGGWFLFVTFEGRLQERKIQEVEQQRLDALAVPTLSETVFYYRENNSAKTNFKQEKAEGALETKYQETIVNYSGQRNPTWQISADGYSLAYQTKKRVLQVHRGNDSYTIDLGEDITDWVLPTNGRMLAIQTKKNDKFKLWIYDLALRKTISQDKNYINSLSGEISKMHYGNDAIIRHFTISRPETLTVYRYSVVNGVFEESLEFSSRRIGQGAELLNNGVSPDGSQVIYKYIRDNTEHLGVTSLNSGTVRDIYRAPNSNSRINETAWAKDSRTIAFTENEGGIDRRIVVLDSGPSTWKVVADANKEGLNGRVEIADALKWKDDGYVLSFVNDGKLYSMEVESQRLEQIDATGVERSGQYGWYFR